MGDVIRAIVISIDAIEDKRQKHTEKEKDFLRVNLALVK